MCPAVGVFQPLIVKDEALDDVFTQSLGGPNAKLGGNTRLDAIADRNDGVELVKRDAALNIPGTFSANSSARPNAPALPQSTADPTSCIPDTA